MEDAHQIVSPPNAGLGDTSANYVYPYQVGSGTMRGTQNVGGGGAQIDSSENRFVLGNIILDGNTGTIQVGKIVINGDTGSITVKSNDGTTLGIGPIPGSTTEYGFYQLDSSGNTVLTIVSGTINVYDPATGKNTIQICKLPDGTYGMAGANTGYNVADGF